MEDSLNEFDLAIHLVGEQAIPNLIGILNIPAKEHLLLTSSRTDNIFDRLQRCDLDQVIHRKLVNPFDMVEISAIVQQYIMAKGGKIAVNITGGTKPMAIGVIDGVRQSKKDAGFFYFDTENEECIYWEDTIQQHRKEAIPKTLRIDDFIKLSEFQTDEDAVDYKRVAQRRDITMKIWEHRRYFQILQSAAQKILTDKNEGPKTDQIDERGFFAVKYNGQEVTYFSINGQEYDHKLIDLTYLSSRWFEEFVYWLLKPLEKEGKITEMRLGMTVKYDGQNDPAQEFDLLATDGLRLWVIECKAGQVQPSMLPKLDEITKRYAGVQGRGILVARWYQNPNKKQFPPNKKQFPENVDKIFQKTEKSEKCALVHGDYIDTILPKNFFEIKPRKIYPEPKFRNF